VNCLSPTYLFVERLDFHWLAGVLEGEGTFLAASPSSPGVPVVRVSMTDRDVIERIGALWGRAVIELPRRRPHHKVPYVTTLKGSSSVRLMTVLAPHMSRARGHQIERAIASWHGHAPRRRNGPPMLEGAEHACDIECNLAWLAGLLEGEGCFTATRADGHLYPVIKLQMCDYDVVNRAANLLGVVRLEVREPRYEHWDRTFVAQLSGQRAAQWMRVLRPFMGQRRSRAIEHALERYEPVRLIRPPTTCVVAECSAPHRARGLCHKHYMSWSRDRARGKAPRIIGLR